MDFEEMMKLLEEKLKNENSNLKPANILIVGKSGVGKSTLINSIFREKMAATGVGSPVTQHLRKITKDGVPISIYDTKGLELDAKVQEIIKKEINDEKLFLLKSLNPDKYIHIVWYCINSGSNRLEDFETDLINELSKDWPVILVLTQNHGKAHYEFTKYVENRNLNVKSVRPVLAQEYEFDEEYIKKPFGLKELVETTYECLPEAYRRAFVNAQIVDLDKKVANSQKAILTAVGTAFGVGYIPIPFSDAAILVPIQIGMIAAITSAFGISHDKELMAAVLASTIGAGGATAAGKAIVANTMKLIPGVGQAIGRTISGSTAALLTATLGFAYCEALKALAPRIYSGEKIDNKEIIRVISEYYTNYLKDNAIVKSLIKGLKFND